MIAVIFSLAATSVLAVGAWLLLRVGLRSGDRPDDATVRVRVGSLTQPDGRWPVIVVTVGNPGPAPVLVGLSARPWRVPGWLDAGRSVSVPAWTLRRRFRPDRQDVVGVVGLGGAGRWQVPPPDGARRCRLVAVVGQNGGRLRVFRVPLGPLPPAAPAAAARTLAGHDS